MAAKLFGSIEAKHGVDEPGYVPPADEGVAVAARERGTHSHELGGAEGVVSFLFPVVGLWNSIRRFGRGDPGSGHREPDARCLWRCAV